MKIDLSKYYLGEPYKTVCHCGHPVHFLMQRLDLDEILPMFILCTECGEISTPKPGGREIISEGV